MEINHSFNPFFDEHFPVVSRDVRQNGDFFALIVALTFIFLNIVPIVWCLFSSSLLSRLYQLFISSRFSDEEFGESKGIKVKILTLCLFFPLFNPSFSLDLPHPPLSCLFLQYSYHNPWLLRIIQATQNHRPSCSWLPSLYCLPLLHHLHLLLQNHWYHQDHLFCSMWCSCLCCCGIECDFLFYTIVLCSLCNGRLLFCDYYWEFLCESQLLF